MIEIVVAVLSSVAGLFIFQFFRKASAEKGQVELQNKVTKLETKAADLQKEIEATDKKTQEQVDEITKEQSIKLTGNALADFFNNRKN